MITSYELRVDNWHITDFPGPENMTDIQKRVIINSFANSNMISSKGVRIVRAG